MVYKAEDVSDLESGAIIHAEVRQGDTADIDPTLRARLMTARATLKNVLSKAQPGQAMSEVCADEGYFATEQIARLQQAGIRTLIGDPQQTRRKKENQTRREKRALHRAKCPVRSASGKAFLRKRGEHLAVLIYSDAVTSRYLAKSQRRVSGSMAAPCLPLWVPSPSTNLYS